MIKRLLSNSIVRYALAGLLVVGAAALLKYFLIDAPKLESARVASTGPERLEEISAFLAKESEPLPELTEWYPADLPCGREVSAPVDPFWNKIGIPANEPTHYQFRLESEGKTYTLIARRDSDCDGLHVVHRVSSRLGYEGNINSHNIGE